MSCHTRRAFTLIELLAVIAIIGILAAILIPVVGKVRESAKAAKCVSNLRSTGTAMLSHINENNGILYTMKSGNTNFLWTLVLRDEGYFNLQTGGVPAESILCPTGQYRDPAHHFDGYGLNVFDPRGGQTSLPGLGTIVYTRNFNDSDLNPTRYILFADSLRTDGRQIFRLYSNNTSGNGSIHLRHGDRANVFFFDGHVEAVGAVEFHKFEPEVLGGFDLEGNPVSFPKE